MHVTLRHAVMVMFMVLPVTLSSGDVIVGGEQLVNPDADSSDNLFGKDSNQGVYVRESAVALEKFALAQRMEGHREWNKSADLFQEILEKYPDRVVPAKLDDEKKTIYQYTSVALAVQERLARWPQEGLDVYRARYETTAATLLSQARQGRRRRDDFGALHKIVSLYFATDSAKAAGIHLIDLYFEHGEFPAAGWMGDRLLQLHPSLIAERPAVLYRTALAHHLSGNQQRASELLEELKQKHADAMGSLRGADASLAASLEQELQIAPPASHTAIADSWPLLGGSPDRARVPAANGRPGAKLFDVPLSRTNWSRVRNAQERTTIEEQDRKDRDSGMMLGVMPAVDRGELFFQDGARVYAVSLDSSFPLSGWAATYGGAAGADARAGGQYAINAWSLPRNQQLTVTLTDDSVVAVMGFPDRWAMQLGIVNGRAGGVTGGGGDQSTRLVCLDRETGRERWVVTPKQLPVENLKGISFCGSPLVISDNVYVVGRGGKGMQFEDCYVVCLDHATGEYRWSSYIASASTANQMWGGEPISYEATSHISYESGRLYVLTNLGALAAVDAYNGAIQWLNIYPRDVVNDFEEGIRGLRGRRMPGAGSADPRPWTQNPVLVRDGRVFVLPSDSQFILAYDAASGAEVKRIRLSDLRGADTLLAVVGDAMIVAGENMTGGRAIGSLYNFNWKTYKFGSTDHRNSDSDVLHWYKDLPAPIRGRGFVTTDSVFIPTSERLFRIGLDSGKVEEMYPRYPSAWEKGEGPGNVLVTQDHVIIAGARRVDVFTDMQVARAKFDARVANAPTEPEPRLLYAEVMFVAGERELAVQKLDEAIALLGGAGSMRPGPDRDRAFNDALAFAQKLADEDKNELISMAIGLFDRAASAAGSASQQVNYRISRAKFAHRVRDFALEASLYQEILSQPPLRIVPLADRESAAAGADAGAVQASVVAERAIANLIKTTGPNCYAPFEQAAGEQLAAARATNDPSKLLQVAQVYPNSSVAPQAMLAAADAFESIGNHRQATQVLRRSYFKYPDSPQSAVVAEAMARNFLHLPGRIDVAVARMGQAARTDPDRRLTKPLVLPDGQTFDDVTFEQAHAALRKLHEEENAPNLADFHLPMPGDPPAGGSARPFVTDGEARGGGGAPDAAAGDIADVSALVLPLPKFERHDRIVAWQSSGMTVYAVGQTTPLFTSGAFAGQPVQCAWTDPRLLAWSANELVALPTEGGEAAWRIDLKSLPPIEVVQIDGDTGDISNDEEDIFPADVPLAGDADIPVLPPGLGPDVGGGLDPDFIQDLQNARLAGEVARAQRGQNRALIAAARRNAVRIGAGGAGHFVAGGAVRDAAPASEQIAFVIPTADRVMVGTTTGRVFAADPETGDLAWQTRLSPTKRITRMLATDDFTVATIADEAGVQIVALDTFEGSFVNRWAFHVESGSIPLNIALSGDGMLVYTLPSKLCGKDLFEPGQQRNYEVPEETAASPLFHGAVAPDQLVIADGRILAVSDNGQFVRVHSLETGELINEQNGLGLLKTNARDWNVSLRLAGPHLYVLGQQSLLAYNLDHTDQVWDKPDDPEVQENFLDAFVGRDYLLVLDQSTRGRPRENKGNEVYRLYGFSRAKVKDQVSGLLKDSGLWKYDEELPEAPKINQWQAVEGGFYYVTADDTLHFLRGARQEPLAQ